MPNPVASTHRTLMAACVTARRGPGESGVPTHSPSCRDVAARPNHNEAPILSGEETLRTRAVSDLQAHMQLIGSPDLTEDRYAAQCAVSAKSAIATLEPTTGQVAAIAASVFYNLQELPFDVPHGMTVADR